MHNQEKEKANPSRIMQEHHKTSAAAGKDIHYITKSIGSPF